MKIMSWAGVAAIVVGVALLAVVPVSISGPPGLPPLDCGTPLSPRGQGFEVFCDGELSGRRFFSIVAILGGAVLLWIGSRGS